MGIQSVAFTYLCIRIHMYIYVMVITEEEAIALIESGHGRRWKVGTKDSLEELKRR